MNGTPLAAGISRIGSLRNFRDAGGLQTEQGRWMKAGILFRSDDLSPLDAGGLDVLQGMGIKLILDLRSPNERAKKLIRFQPRHAIRVESIPFYQNGEDFSPGAFLSFLIKESGTIDFERFMMEFYRSIAFESSEQIRTVLRLLSDERNLPAVIHCTGGKDRTGTMCAFIQLLLGVPRSVVMEQYLATNDRMRSYRKQVTTYLRLFTFFRLSPERLQPFLEARRHYLEDILDEIYSRFPTMEDFLRQYCGVESNTIQQIKKRMLGEKP